MLLSTIDSIITSSVYVGSDPDGPITIKSPTFHPVALSTTIFLSPLFANSISLVCVTFGAFPNNSNFPATKNWFVY